MNASFNEMQDVLTFLQAKGKNGQSLDEIVSGTGLTPSKVKDAIMYYNTGRPVKIIRSGRFYRSNPLVSVLPWKCYKCGLINGKHDLVCQCGVSQ